MAILLVGAALPNFRKTKAFQDLNDFARFEDWQGAQCLPNEDRVGPDKLRLKARLTVLEQ
jgi:hypothetical protein